MKSFRGYITENVLPSAQVADGGMDISKPVVRAAINAALAGVTSAPAVTPYVVFNRISKLLSQYHIIMPKKFLEGDKGVEVFEVRQYGLKMGMTDQGEFIKEVPAQCFLFLQYGIISPMGVTYAKPTVGGMFRVSARLVEKDELDRLLDMAEITMSEEAECRQMAAKAHAPKEPMKDVDDSTEGTEDAAETSQRKKDKKLSADKLDEVSMGKLVSYRRGAEQELGDIKHFKKNPGQYPAATSDDIKAAGHREKTREKGIKLAHKKMTGKAKVGASAPKHPYMEETLDELWEPVTGKRNPKGTSDRKRKAVQMALGKRHQDHPDWNPRTNKKHSALTLGRQLQKQGVMKEEELDEAKRKGRPDPALSVWDNPADKKEKKKPVRTKGSPDPKLSYFDNPATKAERKKYIKSLPFKKPFNEETQIDEKAPPGAKFERMVKHIKKGYSKDGLTAKEKSIAYATAWKAKKKSSD